MNQQKEMAVRYVGNFLDGAMQSVVQKHKTKARRVRGLGQDPKPTVVQTTNPDGSVTSVKTTVNADGSKTIETVTVNTAGDITENKTETIPASVATPKLELTEDEKKALDADLAKIKTAFDTFVSKCHNAFLVSQGVSPIVAGGLGLATKPKSVEKYQGLKTFAILLAGNAVGSAVETSMTNTALEEFFAEISRVVSEDFKKKVIEGSSETFDKQAKVLFAVSGLSAIFGSTETNTLTPTQKYVEASMRTQITDAKSQSTASYAVEIAGEIASVYHGVKRNASEGTFSAVLAGLGWFVMSRSGVGLALAQGFAKPYPGSTRSNPSAKKVIHVNRSGSKMLTHDRRSNPNDGGRSTPTLADLGKARTETIAMSAELQARGMQYTQDPAYIDSSRKAIERIEGVRRDAEHLIEVSGEMGRRLDQNYVEATYALNTALEILGGHLDRIYERTYGESLDSKGVNYAYPSEGLYYFKLKLSGERSNPTPKKKSKRSNPLEAKTPIYPGALLELKEDMEGWVPLITSGGSEPKYKYFDFKKGTVLRFKYIRTYGDFQYTVEKLIAGPKNQCAPNTLLDAVNFGLRGDETYAIDFWGGVKKEIHTYAIYIRNGQAFALDRFMKVLDQGSSTKRSGWDPGA